MEILTFHFSTVQGGYFCMGPMRGLVIIDITMAFDISIECVFPQLFQMGIIQIHFWHYVGNTVPVTGLPRIFCVGIGPQQLGVVLVFHFFKIHRFF